MLDVRQIRVHQNIEIDGQDLGDRRSRKGSRFCNEGKWDNYIKPFLPKNASEMTFLEIGCNAGLFLRLAKEHGFARVIGIEEIKHNCEVGEKCRDSLGLDYEIRNESLTRHYDFDSLPAADYVVMANLHYHLTISTFLYLLDALKHKARHIIIVSAEVGQRRHWKPSANLKETRRYLREFEEAGFIDFLPTEGDSHPRPMYSLLYKTDIKRVKMDDYTARDWKKQDWIGRDATNFALSVLEDPDLDVSTKRYFKDIMKQKAKWTVKMTIDFLEEKRDLITSIKKDGLRRPVILSKGELIDGGHRALAMRVLGHKTILAREL